LEALNNLGYAFFHDGQFKDAVSYFRRTLEINPKQFDVCLSLAEALIHDGRLNEAVVYCQQAIDHQSGNPLAHNLLGIVLSRQAKLQEAIHHYTQALAYQPDGADFHNNLGLALQHQGRLDEALACYRRALDIKPDYSQAHSNLLFALNYISMDPARLFAEHRHFGEIHGKPVAIPAFSNSPDPNRRLRIGYVSPDFRTHSVSYFIEPILAHHDTRQVEVYCYSQTQQTDDTTKRLKNCARHWREIQGRSDAEAVDMIRADGVDILVDLAGHTGHNRLLIFVRRPAPVQVTYLGYPNTTGVAQMDNRITDALADPSGQEAFHTEKLVRLPAGFLCYRPMGDAPAVTPPPVLQSGSITFGSFNSMEKISPQVLTQWANILKALPGSSLILKNKSLKDAMTCRLLLERFQEHGITPQRLELLEWSRSQIDHLAVYNRVDIALDTFPYNGTTTTCEALWMGVPVISLEGTRHAGRVGVSLLTQIGHADMVARTPEDYLRVAVDLAGNRDRLVTLRADLRNRMINSPLCNAKIFTQNLENTYREMWRQWCAEQKPSGNQPDSP
jgi:predicted O-linked N-acetylglucosamine transferase (SPINDLY family)